MKSKLHLAGLLWALLAVGTQSAIGVDYTWTGNASGSWLDQNNWNPKGNPGAGDNVTINTGAGTYPTNAAGEVKDLTLGTCVPLGLGALIVHGNFNFNRGILQNGTLTIDGNGGTMNCNAGGACGNGNSLNNCTVVNNGTINATASGLLFNNATLNNAGTFNLGNQSLTPLIGINQINNSGTFQTAPGTSAGVIGVSFDNAQSVIASSGELRFTGNVTSESSFVALAGATNRFQGTVTNNAGASFSGPGWAVFELTLAVQTAVAADNLELRGAGLQGPGSLSVANNFRWLGGQIKAALTIGAGGHALMPPNAVSGTAISGATVLNSGTWDWQAGTLSGDLGAMFLNDGTFVMHHNGSFERTAFGSGAAPVFVNRAMGTFIKTNDAANGPGLFRAGFNNSGTARIGPNGITLLGGGTNSGTLMVTDTLEFDANYVLDDSSIVNGNGVLRFFLGTVTIAGMYNLDGLTFVDGGTAVFNILNAAGATSGNAAISGGNLAANGPFSVRTNLNWYGGTIAGTNAVTVPTAGKLNVASNTTHFINGGATLNNDGTGLWTDNGPIQFSGSGGIFNNRHNGTFEAHNSAAINGNGIVNNAGAYLKTAAGVSLVNSSVKFNNANSVQVQMGAFQLSGGGTNSGTFDVSANATNEFSGGSYYFVGGNTLSGAGWSRIVNATMIISNSLGAQNFEVNGGTINGPGAFSLSGQFIWDAGATLSPASTVLGPFSQTLLTNTGVKSWSGFITNKGAVTWSGAGNLDSGAGTFFGNAGTFAIVNGANWTAPSGMAFFNAGLFKKALDTNISGLRLWFTNAGMLDVASGTMDFTSGSYLGLSNSVLMGVGVLKGNFPQFGGTRPGESPGALQVIGNFLETNSSILEVEIGGTSPGTNYDKLNVSGGATLGGTLNIILTNGFTPSLGDSFLILTCATRTNKFAAVNGAHLNNGLVLAPIYSNTNVVLKTFAEFTMQGPVRNGTNFTFAFNSASGLSYVVQYADLMPASAWHTLTNFVGDGNLKTVLDSPDLSVIQRYYRICTQ